MPEPDAQVEIQRQRQIYQILTGTADFLSTSAVRPSPIRTLTAPSCSRSSVAAMPDIGGRKAILTGAATSGTGMRGARGSSLMRNGRQ